MNILCDYKVKKQCIDLNEFIQQKDEIIAKHKSDTYNKIAEDILSILNNKLFQKNIVKWFKDNPYEVALIDYSITLFKSVLQKDDNANRDIIHIAYEGNDNSEVYGSYIRDLSAFEGFEEDFYNAIISMYDDCFCNNPFDDAVAICIPITYEMNGFRKFINLIDYKHDLDYSEFTFTDDYFIRKEYIPVINKIHELINENSEELGKAIREYYSNQ